MKYKIIFKDKPSLIVDSCDFDVNNDYIRLKDSINKIVFGAPLETVLCWYTIEEMTDNLGIYCKNFDKL